MKFPHSTQHHWLLSVAQQPNLHLVSLTVKVSRSHTNRQMHSRVLTHTSQNKHNRRTSLPSGGFEPAIPAIEQPRTNALDRMATATGGGDNRLLPVNSGYVWSTYTAGSRFSTDRFTTIHFYDPCRVGPSTPTLWCITVATQTSILYLVRF